MFEVGWTEMLVIAIVMIVVVGPKDLPNMLRTFGRTVAKLRAMAGDFQKQFNDALKEAELDDVKKSVDALRGLNPVSEIRKQLNPFEKAAADVRSGLNDVMKPKPAADPSAPAAGEATAVEPLKNGATSAPGVAEPEANAAFPAMTDSSVVAQAAATADPVKTSATRKAVKAAAPKAAKSAPVAKAASARSTPAPVAAKATPAPRAAPKIAAPVAKPGPQKPDKPKIAKPMAKTVPVKASSAKAEAKPAPASVEKPAAAKKKTAGTAK